jgi:hypothetical protein
VCIVERLIDAVIEEGSQRGVRRQVGGEETEQCDRTDGE